MTESIDLHSLNIRIITIITKTLIYRRFKHYMSNSLNEETQFKLRQMLKCLSQNCARNKRSLCVYNSKKIKCLF
jgi:hypothetical protein